jgi:hypothetical protein
VDVEPVGGVDARGGLHRIDVQILEWPQIEEVEKCPQIDVEPLRPLPGKHRFSAGQDVDRVLGERGVIRCGKGADVARRRGQVFGQDSLAAVLHPGH